jgi:peroxiredoxin Q/BCP
MKRSKSIEVGDQAPDFTLPSSRGGSFTLSSQRGQKNVVLFFYPKDDTPGCTAEACTFRDQYDAFAAAGAEVVGVSSDSLDAHGRFASKHGLPMHLLSDEGGKVRAAYGVKSTFGLLPGRVTYVIDTQGVVRHVFSSQLRATQHVREALEMLARLGSAGGATARTP